MENHLIIMAGGIGSRFWPMSTPDCPKQFIDVLGCGKSMLRLTVDRLKDICPAQNVWVVTSALYADKVREQLPEIPVENILAEPAARNTAPCIAYACWKISTRTSEANIVVTPSDAFVLDSSEYRRVIIKAMEQTGASDAIVTVGIKPTRPETGYGYIASRPMEGEVRKVLAFKEKPSREVAEQYLKEGNYLWNAGIFVWNLNTIVSNLRRYVPQICSVMDEMSRSFGTAAEASETERLFPSCEKISIDYAVMEKAENILTIPGDFGWSDLGSWGSLRANLDRDAAGNAVVGRGVSLYECEGCVVHTPDLDQVILQGLKDCIVAEKDGRLLVCSLSEEQRIKDFH